MTAQEILDELEALCSASSNRPRPEAGALACPAKRGVYVRKAPLGLVNGFNLIEQLPLSLIPVLFLADVPSHSGLMPTYRVISASLKNLQAAEKNLAAAGGRGNGYLTAGINQASAGACSFGSASW